VRIGIIGAGNIGGNLARNWRALGHEVAIANSRGPETLADLAAETGAIACHATEAAAGADVVVVTIPMRAIAELPPGILDGAPDHAAIIDTNNYYPKERDGRIPGIEDEGLTESGWVARTLGRPVIKVFNGVPAANLVAKVHPKGHPDRLAIPVAGAPGPAKERVMALVEEMGFDAIDGGTIEESWRQQPGTPGYGLELRTEDARRALAEASPERAPAFSG
jgi:predicted dinucleotide-binding enzyme